MRPIIEPKLYRIAKYIARVSNLSRRDAEKAITMGRVKINDNIELNLAIKVDNSHIIKLDNKILPKILETRLWLYNKPSGLITTKRDELSRETIFDRLGSKYENLITVGRLDKNTEGLLLLTNDGDFARELELPKNNYKRVYLVKIFGLIDRQKISQLEKNCQVGDVKYKKIIIKICKESKNNGELEITIFEGKNREVRNIVDYLGLKIKTLKRIQFGPYYLGLVASGKIVELDI